ncbi:TPA: hypothetical protein ACIZB4_003150 [Legionella pneumophila]|uniref:hypothetical protein n=1 Tax=Legionella pneumophila TaxID=446 RepID=UPI000488F4F7|nr:hypothetical protein [Legionella pneumophila]ANH12923.1 hypothetical protein A5478_07705 [Legionella pneumophila]ANH15890.1 hypothetical protein A5480_07700 [Legionella pneumophila]ANH18856.1 hypothetical protein A5479_07700 [Legionella pneumophila]APX19743.1 hypothetical protein A1D14_07715 [Legionella pneumophila]AQL11920.1 hypothetical protein A1D13_07715 [Legionella pneumophila]
MILIYQPVYYDETRFSAKIIILREVYGISYKLTKVITQSAYQFDVVVAVTRGGFPAARFICDFLNIRQLGSMQISDYVA